MTRIVQRWLPPSLMASLASVLTLAATYRGPGLTTDSVAYLSSGISLSAGRGLRMLDNSALTLFPPGLPVVAATGEWLGVGAQLSVRLFNTAMAAVLVMLAFALLDQVLRSRTFALVGTALVAVSSAMLGVSKMAWTEAPFIVISLCLLLTLNRALKATKVTASTMLILVGLCWLGFLFRYVGVTFIATAVIVIWFAPHVPRRRRSAMTVGVLASVIPLIWIARNHHTDGTLLGPRQPSSDSLAMIIGRVVRTLGSWMLPVAELPGIVHFTIGALTLGGTVVLLTVRWHPSAEQLRPGSASDRSSLIVPLASFILTYLAYVVMAQLTTSFDALDSRLLSPLYVPLIALAGVAVERIGWPKRTAAAVRISALVAGSFLVGQFLTSVRDVRAGFLSGIGFNSRSSAESDLGATMAGIASRDPDAPPIVFTNRPGVLWSSSGLQPLYSLPSGPAIDRERLLALTADQTLVDCTAGDLFLAVFDSIGDAQPTVVLDDDGLRLVGHYSDGRLYQADLPASGWGCASSGSAQELDRAAAGGAHPRQDVILRA